MHLILTDEELVKKQDYANAYNTAMDDAVQAECKKMDKPQPVSLELTPEEICIAICGKWCEPYSKYYKQCHYWKLGNKVAKAQLHKL